MDLPKKHSSRYVAGVYAVFIVLFVFTLSLFYISRCQESSRLAKQDAETDRQKDSAEATPIELETIDSPKEQPQNRIDVSTSDQENDNEIDKAPPSPKVLDGNNIDIDKTKDTSNKVPKPKNNQIQNKSPSISSRQNSIIFFSDESTGLTDPALKKLKTVYLFLLEYPDEEIIVAGYGDSNKTNRHNINLSKLRANIVKDYFSKRGISNSRLKATWMGSQKSAENSDYRDDGNKTHRVEIKFKFRSKEWLE